MELKSLYNYYPTDFLSGLDEVWNSSDKHIFWLNPSTARGRAVFARGASPKQPITRGATEHGGDLRGPAVGLSHRVYIWDSDVSLQLQH